MQKLVHQGQRKKRTQGGRPTKLTMDLAIRIAEKIRVGCCRSVAARAEGVSQRTFFAWMSRGTKELKTCRRPTIFTKLVLLIDRCEALHEAECVSRVYNGAPGWRAALAMLKRIFALRKCSPVAQKEDKSEFWHGERINEILHTACPKQNSNQDWMKSNNGVRCVAHTKAGGICQAYAMWSSKEKLCAVHSGRHHSGKMGNPSQPVHSKYQPCRCSALPFPHRPQSNPDCTWERTE